MSTFGGGCSGCWQTTWNGSIRKGLSTSMFCLCSPKSIAFWELLLSFGFFPLKCWINKIRSLTLVHHSLEWIRDGVFGDEWTDGNGENAFVTEIEVSSTNKMPPTVSNGFNSTRWLMCVCLTENTIKLRFWENEINVVWIRCPISHQPCFEEIANGSWTISIFKQTIYQTKGFQFLHSFFKVPSLMKKKDRGREVNTTFFAKFVYHTEREIQPTQQIIRQLFLMS